MSTMKRMWTDREIRSMAVDSVEKKNNLKVFEHIADKDGHKRFIEGDGTPATDMNFTSDYCKWSLSGSHLMLVLGGSVENGATTGSGKYASYSVPEWVTDKIIPLFDGDKIEIKVTSLIADDWTTEGTNLTFILAKGSNGLELYNYQVVETTKARVFRVQFDLLIDNE